MNKELFKFYGVTKEDYLKWCKDNNLPHYKNEVLRKFVELLTNGEFKKGDNDGNN